MNYAHAAYLEVDPNLIDPQTHMGCTWAGISTIPGLCGLFFPLKANRHPALIPWWPDWSTRIASEERVGLTTGGAQSDKRFLVKLHIFFPICRLNLLACLRCTNCFSPRCWHSQLVYWPTTVLWHAHRVFDLYNVRGYVKLTGSRVPGCFDSLKGDEMFWLYLMMMRKEHPPVY